MQERNYYGLDFSTREACPFLASRGFRFTDTTRESVRICLSCPLKDKCIYDFGKQEQVRVKRELMQSLGLKV